MLPNLAPFTEHNGQPTSLGRKQKMDVEKVTEQRRDDKRKRPDLDKRYGEIGISAVAGALKHHPCDEPRKRDRQIVPDDCD